MLDIKGWNSTLIYQTILDNLLKQMKLFGELKEAFAVMNLHGYKRWAMYESDEVGKYFDKVERQHIEIYGKIPPAAKWDSMKTILPAQFADAKFESISNDYKQKFIKDAFAEVIKHCENAVEMYAAAYHYAVTYQTHDVFLFKKLYKKALKKHKRITRYVKMLTNVNYSMSDIVGSQKEMHDYYKSKH